MSPVIVKTFRVRTSHVAALIALVFMLFVLSRQFEDMASRNSVAAMSLAVANRVIVIDPGHGGMDPGLVSKKGAVEKDITLAVGKLLASHLGQAGSQAIMTRDSDTDLSNPETVGITMRKKEDLLNRVALANDNRADLYISIHTGESSAQEQRGAQVYYQKDSVEGKKVAQFIHSELARTLKNTGGPPREVDDFVTRNTTMPAVVVDIGYMTNESDEKLLLDQAYLDRAAWSIYAGVVKYLGQMEAEQTLTEKEKVIQTFKEQVPRDIKEP